MDRVAANCIKTLLEGSTCIQADSLVMVCKACGKAYDKFMHDRVGKHGRIIITDLSDGDENGYKSFVIHGWADHTAGKEEAYQGLCFATNKKTNYLIGKLIKWTSVGVEKKNVECLWVCFLKFKPRHLIIVIIIIRCNKKPKYGI